jgi:hypothetical protein
VKKRPTEHAGDSAAPPEFMGGWHNPPSAQRKPLGGRHQSSPSIVPKKRQVLICYNTLAPLIKNFVLFRETIDTYSQDNPQ